MTGEYLIVGGGCFWCLEAVIQQLHGVKSVVPGYAGGTIPNPTYEQICTGNTEYAEVVQIRFDSGVISLRTLLQVFFLAHDPTTFNRQGADVGTQYRSIVFYLNDKQKNEAEELIAEIDASKQWYNPIVTQLKPLGIFYEAEEHHHNYYTEHSSQPYCQAVISPKLSKLKKTHSSLFLF